MRFEQTQHNQACNPAVDTSERMVAEVHSHERHKTCTNGFDNAGQLADFGKGVVVGAVEGGVAFIEFVANPDSLHQMCAGAGNAIGTAAEYYGGKIGGGHVADIAKDAGDAANAAGKWLTEYGMKTPYERGKISGKAAADMLIAEASLGVAKSVLGAAKAGDEAIALQSSSRSRAEFENFLRASGDAGAELAPKMTECAASAGFARNVDALVDALPKSLQNFLKDNNIKICSVKEIGKVRPEFPSADGLFTQEENASMAHILLSENMHIVGDFINLSKLELTLRHEIAHAIDAWSMANGWVSDSPAIQKLFSEEFGALDSGSQNFLKNTIGRGSEATMRREVVAEVVSRCAVPGTGLYYKFFLSSFPKLSKMLNESTSPFRFE